MSTSDDPSRAAERSPFAPSRLLPGLTGLRGYRRHWLTGDLIAGTAVAAYLVPQVMAYAEVARLPAIVGLWACIGPLLVYVVLGSSRLLSPGAESTTALMTAAAAAAVAHDAGVAYSELAAALALAMGVLCVLGWLGRLGFIASLISRPVLVGYMAGIAILMIISQLPKLTGVDLSAESVTGRLGEIVQHLDEVDPLTFALSTAALAALLLLKRTLPRLPGTLIVMVIAAIVVGVLGLDAYGIRTVGEVPVGLPAPEVPSLRGISVAELTVAAIGLAIIAYSDNVLTARAFADRHRERIDPNQELLALGVSNIATSFFHGFPTSSSASRTALADSAGARTRAYSLVTLMLVVATLLFLGPALETFPTAVLGAVVVYAALQIVDLGELRRIARFSRPELVLSVLTTLAVVLLGVLPGIGVAVGLSILLLLRDITRPHDAVLGRVHGVAGMHDIEDYPSAKQVPGLVIYRYDAPLFFANADDFRDRARDALRNAQDRPHWFALNMEANIELDLTAADALEDLRRNTVDAGAEFAIVRVKQEVRDTLQAAGLLERIGEDRVFMTLPTMVDAYTVWHHAVFNREPEADDDPQ